MNYDEHIKMILDAMYDGYLTFDETVSELSELIMEKTTEEIYEKFMEATSYHE